MDRQEQDPRKSTAFFGMGVLVLAIGLAGCASGQLPRHDWYFPADVDDMHQQWFGSQLHAMKEPVLGKRVTQQTGITELRVLCLPTWGHGVAVRYTFDDGAATRRAVELTGNGGYAPGKIAIDRTTSMLREETATLLASLDASGFWSMPVEEDTDIVVMDGTMVVVEAVRDGAHRVIARPEPGAGAYKRGLAKFFDFYMPAFSIAPAQKSGAATLSSFSKGYGTSK